MANTDNVTHVTQRANINAWNRGVCLGLGVRAQLLSAGLIHYTGASWVPTARGVAAGLTLCGLGGAL